MERIPLPHDGDLVTAVAWHPDGALVLLGLADGIVSAWNVRTRAEAARFRAHTGDGAHPGSVVGGPHPRVSALAVSPDGSRLATGGGDGRVSVWETAAVLSGAPAGQPALALEEAVTALAWSADSQTLAASDGTQVAAVRDGTVQWHQRSPRRIEHLVWSRALMGGGDGVFALDDGTLTVVHPDGPVLGLCYNHEEWKVTLVGLASGRTLAVDHPWEDERTLADGSAPVTCWSATPARGYNWLVSGHGDGTLAVHLTTRSRDVVRPHAVWSAHRGPVRSVACAPDGFGVVSVGADGAVSLWQQGEATVEDITKLWPQDLDLSAAGARMLTGATAIHLASGRGPTVDDPRWGGFAGGAWTPAGEIVTVDTEEATLRRFDVTGGVLAVRAEQGWFRAGPAVDRRGRIALSTSAGLLVLDEAFREIRRIETPSDVVALAWSSTGLLAGVHASGTLTVWADEGELWSLPGPSEASGRQVLSWSPDGAVIAVARQPVVLVEVATQNVLCELPWSRAVAFSPDGAHVALGGYPEVVTVWAWREGRPVAFWVRSARDGARERMLLAWHSADRLEIVTDATATIWRW